MIDETERGGIVAESVPSRRRHARVDVADDRDYRIEFRSPYDRDTRLDLQIQDLSLAGISFALDGILPGLEVGSTVPNVTLHLGPVRARGELLVCHVTARRGQPPMCGTLFYPRTDKDLAALKNAFTALDAS